MDKANKLLTAKFLKWFTTKARKIAYNRRWFIDTDDLIQDTLIRVSRAIENGKFTYTNEKEFQSYTLTCLTSTAKNALSKEAKRRDKKAFSIDQVSKDSDREFDLPAPTTDTVNDERRAELDNLIESLTPRRRTVINLVMQNYKTEDIVTYMRKNGEPNISPLAVSRLKMEAIKSLKKSADRLPVAV